MTDRPTARRPATFRLDDPHVTVMEPDDEAGRLARGTIRITPEADPMAMPVVIDEPLRPVRTGFRWGTLFWTGLGGLVLLGTGLGAEDLPIPRLIVVKLADDRRTDMDTFRRVLTAEVPSASLDDHRQWFDRLRAMARAVIVVGLVIVALMIAATGLSVVFATRAAVETNRPVVEVLHFVGARDAFIAGEFQRHFLWLALKGSLAGGFAALGAIMLSGFIAARWRATAGGDQIEALFGSFALGATGYAAIAGLVVLVTAVAALTCRWTVVRTLGAID